MATRYWRGGSGSWDSGNTANWSATSGGAGGASVPTATDDVIFNSASSASSYVVTCYYSNPVCKSITTAAPAAGTLSFTATSSGDNYFQVNGGNINVHAACLFTTRGAAIVHIADPTGGTNTVTFNGAGVNTQNIRYYYNGLTSSNVLNFCLAQTCQFCGVEAIGANSTFTCTGATITVTGADVSSGYYDAKFYLDGFATINMTTTTLTAGGVTVPTGLAPYGIITLGYSGLVTFNAATLAIGMPSVVYTSTLTIGSSTAPATTAPGTITVSNVGDKYIYADKLSVINHNPTISGFFDVYSLTVGTISTATGTVSGAITCTNTGTLFFVSNFTVTGAVTNAADNAMCLSGTYVDVVFNGAVTLLGDFGVLDSTATATFNAAFSAGNLTYSGGDPFTASVGTITSNVSTALTGTGGVNVIGTLVTPTFSMPNSSLVAGTLTVNGGSGKSFVVGATTATQFIAAVTTTITTPTCTIAATSPYRINWGIPNMSGVFGINYTLSISGSTPTLNYVSFINTSINGGATNYLGLRLGTDGISNGFFPEPAKVVYLKAVTGSYDFYSAAIWALTEGGTATTNSPLPQDTIVVGADSAGQSISIADTSGWSLYIGSYNTTSAAGTVTLGSFSYPTYIFGSLYMANTIVETRIPYLYFAPSGTSNRYLTTYGNLYVFYGLWICMNEGDTLTVGNASISSEVRCSDFRLFIGDVIFVGNPTIRPTSSELTQFIVGGNNARASLSGLFSVYTYALNYYSGTQITNTNYTVYMRTSSSSLSTSTYSNAASSTAKNGYVISNGFTLTVNGGSTTATNPLRGLAFAFSAAGSGSQQVKLSGNLYVQALVAANTSPTVSATLASTSATSWTIYKTNGGTAYFDKQTSANVTVNNIQASPANTFYTNGTRTGNTTGWNPGAPPSAANSGFLMF